MEQESVLTSSSEHIAHFIQSEGSSQFTWPSHWTLSEIPSYPLVSQYVRKYLNLSFFFSEEFFIVVHNLLRVLSPSENTCKSSGWDSLSGHFMAFINTHLALIAAILSCTNTLYDTPNSVFLRFYFLIFLYARQINFICAIMPVVIVIIGHFLALGLNRAENCRLIMAAHLEI